MSLKPTTIIEKDFPELLRTSLSLVTGLSELINKGSVLKKDIEKLKKYRDSINRIMENW